MHRAEYGNNCDSKEKRRIWEQKNRAFLLNEKTGCIKRGMPSRSVKDSEDM